MNFKSIIENLDIDTYHKLKQAVEIAVQMRKIAWATLGVSA